MLLLEAGGKDDYIWIHIPVGYLYTMGDPRMDWCFTTEPEAHLRRKRMHYPRGRVLGGSSSINGMIYNRGQRADSEGATFYQVFSYLQSALFSDRARICHGSTAEAVGRVL